MTVTNHQLTTMKLSKSLYTLIFLAAVANTAAAQLSFDSPVAPVTVTPESSTGLNAVYVVESLNGVKMTYNASTATVKWYRYANLGGGYAEEVTPSRNGNAYTLVSDGSDMGYIIDDGTTRRCYWVVNYANHRLQLDALTVSDESDCNRVVLTVSGSAGPITYYSINGRGCELSRELKLSYLDLEFDSDSHVWRQLERSTTLAAVSSVTSITAPLCNTAFTLTGDRFLTSWGKSQSIESPSYTTMAVSAETTAEQEVRDVDNEKKYDTASGLGGSAPAEIKFVAYPTDAAVYREWQLSNSSEFDDILDRYNTDDMTYTFRDNGTTYVRYVCADASGACTYEGQAYEVSIGESALEIPNAFSPANQDGVNDVWKVSYRSLISFECHIFNRAGIKMATLTSPDQGWDGKYKGKFVPAGVYFYVIKAVGADGRKYDRGGDINIINSRLSTNNSSSDSDSAE